MCGIVGSISTKTNIIPILLDGLKTLEYRGYDSAGLSYIKDSNLIINKVKGRVKDLENHISKESANIGIAHTRWATHGKVNEINAHPHNVGKITIVHNGIIENFSKLKHKLEEKGYQFKSEADTEIAAGLLDYYYKKYENIDKAIQKFMKKVDGSYAICMIINDDPNTIYVIKKDSPLIIGTGNHTNYIASDVPAILKYTKNYYILEDYEYGKVTADNITIYDKEGNVLNKQLKEYQGSDLTSDKGIYEHYMLKEIMEQNSTIRKTVNPYINSIEDLLKLPDLTKYERIDIIACGTAMHAGLAAKYLFEEYTNTKCEVFLASEYRYQNNFLNNKVLSIFISQSGETADTLAALKKVKEANFDTLGIVNVKESSIARALDKVLYTEAGTEIAVVPEGLFGDLGADRGLDLREEDGLFGQPLVEPVFESLFAGGVAVVPGPQSGREGGAQIGAVERVVGSHGEGFAGGAFGLGGEYDARIGEDAEVFHPGVEDLALRDAAGCGAGSEQQQPHGGEHTPESIEPRLHVVPVFGVWVSTTGRGPRAVRSVCG